VTLSPEQIEAALPAMRRWARTRLTGSQIELLGGTRAAVAAIYPGGVEQFIADQEAVPDQEEDM